MKKRIGIGIVGTGTIGIRGALEYLSIPDVQDRVWITGVCDPYPGCAKAAAKGYDISTYYETYDELLDSPNIDTVTIYSPINFHYEHAWLRNQAFQFHDNIKIFLELRLSSTFHNIASHTVASATRHLFRRLKQFRIRVGKAFQHFLPGTLLSQDSHRVLDNFQVLVNHGRESQSFLEVLFGFIKLAVSD